MERVTITAAAAAHPPYRISQDEAARALGEFLGEPRRAAAIARGTRIEQRATCIPPAMLRDLGTIEERNRLYAREAAPLALEAASRVLCSAPVEVGFLAASSCTGYQVPGWDVALIEALGLSRDTVRLPITQAGCSGGVLALARAADYLRSRPGSAALVVACELCSLAFQPSTDEGSLTSNLIFGDGAGAAVLRPGEGFGGLEVVDSASVLAPAPARVLGFDLTDRGFTSLLSRDLVDVLPPATEGALSGLLGRHGLSAADVSFWLLHPGGARILTQIELSLALPRCSTRWSWESMAEWGNTSSAAVLDVVRRYLSDGSAPGGWGVVAAFGPGISIELLLVRRC